VTVKVVEPLMVPDVALMALLPCATVLASPLLLIVAMPVAEDAQVAVLLRLCVVPLEYVPVAVNCWVFPNATEGNGGVTEIETSTGAVTVNVADPVIVPDFALMVAVPCATLVARPALTVATPTFDELQFAELVRFCLVPLL